MANSAVELSGVLLDGAQTPGEVVSYLNLPDTSTLAQLTSALNVWAAAVDGTIDGAFLKVFAKLTPPLPGGLKAASGPTWLGSRIQQTGNINFSATGTTRRYGQALPSLSNAAITGNTVDISNTAIQALIALLLNPTGFFTNAQSQSLEAALDALLSFRKFSFILRTSAANVA